MLFYKKKKEDKKISRSLCAKITSLHQDKKEPKRLSFLSKERRVFAKSNGDPFNIMRASLKVTFYHFSFWSRFVEASVYCRTALSPFFRRHRFKSVFFKLELLPLPFFPRIREKKILIYIFVLSPLPPPPHSTEAFFVSLAINKRTAND